jgi:hypothetical protein
MSISSLKVALLNERSRKTLQFSRLNFVLTCVMVHLHLRHQTQKTPSIKHPGNHFFISKLSFDKGNLPPCIHGVFHPDLIVKPTLN